MKHKKFEYKKIILGVIALWSILLVTFLSVIGISENLAVSLVYTVLGSYIAYCGASAADKYSYDKYVTKTFSESEDENGR